MHDDELKIKLHDYFDELLTPEEEADFQILLMENRNLAIELGKLKDLKRRLKNMPLSFDPPPGIIENIIEKLHSQEKTISKKVEDEKPMEVASKLKRRKSRSKKKFLSIFLKFLLIILLVGGSGGYYYYYITKPTTPWRVNIVKGEARIGYTVNGTKISENQVFELVEDGEADIYVNDLAVINVNKNVKFEILTANQNKNLISFRYGNLEYTPKLGSKRFEIQIGPLLVISTNSKLKISTDQYGDYELEIISNFLNIELYEDSYRFSRDYIIKIDANREIRIPYNKKSTRKFIKLVENYFYKNDPEILDKIITNASFNDAFTLHYLLPQVTPAKRELIIKKLQSLVPLPFGVEISDILILNKEMLNKWWDEIYSAI
ncbi:MAG: hypothetical protein ABFS12_07115, partial [Bacteroidota bacterium]